MQRRWSSPSADRSRLKELDENDILSITYNGRTIETRAGEIGGEKVGGASEKLEGPNSQKKQKLKHLARTHPKEVGNVSGTKCRTMEGEEDNEGKKQCMEEDIKIEKVEGASPKMAPTLT